MARSERLTQVTRRCAVCLLALAWGTGCQVYDPGLLEQDAGSSGCELRRPPTRPDVADGDDEVEYVFGLREVVLEQSGEVWRDLGFDLDGLCTTSENFVTECVPPGRPRPPTDGNGGIDNTFGDRLFPLVDITVPGLQETAQAAQDEGKLPAIRLRGWNGQDDDPRVDVAITNAIFTVPAAPDGSVPDFEIEGFLALDPDTGDRLLPEWDGTDYGFFRNTTFFDDDPDQPLLRDDNAYVVDRQVVARLPERVEILFPADDVGVLVRLTDATAVGTLSEDLQTLDDVVVTGRWKVLDLLSTAENVGVCRGTDNYRILSGQLDSIADIRSMPGSGGEDVECDAVSMGVGFRGYRMQWGGLTPGPPVRNLCTEGDGGVPDAGMPDAGMPDAGTPDAGTGTDAGVDAGTTTDTDAG